MRYRYFVCINTEGGGIIFVKVPADLRDHFFGLVAYKVYFGECDNLKLQKEFKKEMIVPHDEFAKKFHDSLKKALNSNKNSLHEWKEKQRNAKFFDDMIKIKDQVNYLQQLIETQTEVLQGVERYIKEFCQKEENK